MRKKLLDEPVSVSARIGEDFKRWSGMDCILIDAPTGSGKTTFILKTLLPYLVDKGQRILYLVNRRILKKQLEEELLRLPFECRSEIEIVLYQEIEKKLCSIENDKVNKGDAVQGRYYSELEKFSGCDCVVCDEAHYFLMDSSYNTNTSISFHWIQAKFRDKLSIFMSATCDDIRSYIQGTNKYNPKAVYTAYYNICKQCEIRELNGRTSLSSLTQKIKEQRGKEVQKLDDLEKRPVTIYDIARNYDYIDASNIHIINKKEDIVDLVAEGKDKWIIFIDSIKHGRELEAAIKRKLSSSTEGSSSKKDDPIMICSGYKRDKAGNDAVDLIIKDEVPFVRVFITTSVLDNGINIKDIELRNVVLFADTETEFIQMLGRKRKDGLPLNLYIYRYDETHFRSREKQFNQRKKLTGNYLKYIEGKIRDLKTKDRSGDWFEPKNLCCLNECEKECVKRQHIKLMQDLFDQYIEYEDVSSAFTVFGGLLYLSMLSFQNIENLSNYYLRMIEKFEAEGEDAFVKEQLHWLGKDREAEDIIKESHKSNIQKALERIVTRIHEAGVEWMPIETYDNFMNEEQLKSDLLTIFKPVYEKRGNIQGKNMFKTTWNALRKTTSHVRPAHVDCMVEYCGFPFKLEEQGKKYKFVDLKVTEDEKI